MDTHDQAAPGEVTRLLALAGTGDRGAIDHLFPRVYGELRRMARLQLGRSAGAITIEPTGLVHEAYMKLARGGAIQAEGRAHFLAIAGRAMRQVLVDRARSRGARKRGGGAMAVTLMDGHSAVEMDPARMLALNDAIEALEPRQRQVVEARFFAGLEEREIAELLGVSERTVRRDWVKARAWITRALVPAGPEDGPDS
jgi:RNA polymerase sigma factor (TIGR02999 family)